ncbi:septum site-determining protein Ssd, partial [Actinocorallia lasiicapitis]
MNALLLSRDPGLTDDLLRLAAAASVELAVPRAPTHAHWHDAPLILLGIDLPLDSYPRRPGVVLVTRAENLDSYRRLVEVGAERLAVLPAAEPWLIELLSSAARPSPQGRVVAVTGARGGAGATVLAATLAETAARHGLNPLLIDADPHSCGLEILLGLEQAPGPRWPDLATLRGRLPHTALTSLPTYNGVSVLSHHHSTPTTPPLSVLTAVLATARTTHDLTILDLPRHYPPPSLTDRTLLLVPADLPSTLTAAALAPLLPAPL